MSRITARRHVQQGDRIIVATRHVCRIFCAGLLGLVMLADVQAAQLAVVIDDVGYNRSRGLRAVNLPGAVTIAVLPHAPHARELARRATLAGKDLIVHQPMQPHPSDEVRIEQDTLTLHMPDADFDAALERAFERFPQGKGVSNHTGSLLTQHRAPMQRLMGHLQARNLFFLDSRTTADTVAQQVADEYGVPALRRDVFLDHDRRPANIAAAFARAVRLAQRRGQAVLVGHPYPASLDVLEKVLTQLPEGVQLVSAATLAARLRSQPLSVARRAPPVLPTNPASPHISLGQ